MNVGIYRAILFRGAKIVGWENESVCLEYNGIKWWYKNEQLHRENGPAVEYRSGDRSGDKEWWINGQYIRCNKD